MQSKETREETIQRLIDEFRHYVLQFFLARENIDVPEHLAGEYHDKLNARFKDISKLGEDAKNSLARLMDDERPEVRLYAATYSYDIDPRKAEETYSELSGLPGFVGLSAQAGLNRVRGIDPYSNAAPPLSP